MYKTRHIEQIITKATKQTKVVLLTGSRQVGKSSCYMHLFPDYEYITLDDENELYLATEDRNLFFKDRTYPLIIDEIQYVKELFQTIKLITDRSSDKGQILITGSQTYELLSASAESLSGRITILEMPSLSMRELNDIDFNKPFVPDEEYIPNRAKHIVKYSKLWEQIFRGSMPELLDTDRDREWFYRDYVRTYIERDVRRLINIKDELAFRQFVTAVAGRSGQMLVYDDIAKDVGIDSKTAKSWLSVLNGSGLIKLVPCYSNNILKRGIKSPKLYMMDTGLMCYLTGWETSKGVMNGPMSGQIFETFIVSEIIKSYLNCGMDMSKIYYYRDKDKREIDLVIDYDHTLYPIEIKKGATVKKDWAKNLNLLDNIKDRNISKKIVISQVDRIISVNDDCITIPIEYI